MPVAKKSPKSAPKTAPKSKAPARKPKAAPAPKKGGHSKETLAFAAKVVKLRDSGLPWKVVAERTKTPYTANGSSKLRRAYTIGNGATVGVRSKATK